MMGRQMNQWLYPVIVDRILIEDEFVDSEFKELIHFFCRDPVDIHEINAGRNFGIDNL